MQTASRDRESEGGMMEGWREKEQDVHEKMEAPLAMCFWSRGAINIAVKPNTWMEAQGQDGTIVWSFLSV